MNPFRSLNDAEPALSNASLLKAALLTIDYIENNGAIGLTAAKAFKRHFVAWAAEAFHWPHYTTEDLYAVNKVLNEHDFPPLMILHEILLSAKLARHFKGAMHLTKLARQLRSRPAQLWTLLATHLLFVLDHGRHSRSDEPPIGNWDIGESVIVDHIIDVAGAQQIEEIMPALRGGRTEPGEMIIADVGAIAVLRLMPRAGIIDRQPWRAGQPRAQRITGFGEEGFLPVVVNRRCPRWVDLRPFNPVDAQAALQCPTHCANKNAEPLPSEIEPSDSRATRFHER